MDLRHVHGRVSLYQIPTCNPMKTSKKCKCCHWQRLLHLKEIFYTNEFKIRYQDFQKENVEAYCFVILGSSIWQPTERLKPLEITSNFWKSWSSIKIICFWTEYHRSIQYAEYEMGGELKPKTIPIWKTLSPNNTYLLVVQAPPVADLPFSSNELHNSFKEL